MNTTISEQIGFIGAGNIAEAWIERLVKSKSVNPEQVLAADIRAPRLQKLAEDYGIRTSPNNRDAAEFADILILAVPPPVTLPVLAEFADGRGSGQIVISLAAAVPLDALEALGPARPVIRVMPNTPALVGEAMNVACFGAVVSPLERKRVENLLRVLGKWEEVPDTEMDLWCALCAVGPTYILPVIEALAGAATRHGLPPELALQASAQMIAGTARMVQASGRMPDQLEQMISLRTLKKDEARLLFTQAYDEAVQKLQATGQKVRESAMAGSR